MAFGSGASKPRPAPINSNGNLVRNRLAKLRGISQEQMFGQLTVQGLIEKHEEKWQLTDAGTAAGGVYLTGRYGQYIAWPEDFQVPSAPSKTDAPKLLTATVQGQQFELPAKKMNYILSELGWIKKGLKGWLVTEQDTPNELKNIQRNASWLLRLTALEGLNPAIRTQFPAPFLR